jgi:hypothetical protein
VVGRRRTCRAFGESSTFAPIDDSTRLPALRASSPEPATEAYDSRLSAPSCRPPGVLLRNSAGASCRSIERGSACAYAHVNGRHSTRFSQCPSTFGMRAHARCARNPKSRKRSLLRRVALWQRCWRATSGTPAGRRERPSRARKWRWLRRWIVCVLDRRLPVAQVFPVREESQGPVVMFYVPFAISALCFIAIAVLVLRDD